MAKNGLRPVIIRNIQKTAKNGYLIEFVADMKQGGGRPQKPSAEEMSNLDDATMDILNHVMDIEERSAKQDGLGYRVKLGYDSKGRVMLRDRSQRDE